MSARDRILAKEDERSHPPTLAQAAEVEQEELQQSDREE